MAPRKHAGKKRARSPDGTTATKDATRLNTDQPAPAEKRARALTLPEGEQPNEPLEAQPSSSVQAKETFGKEAVAGVEGDAQGKGSGGQTEQDPASIFAGRYDLYGMKLPFMVSAYALASGPRNPEALYKTMLEYQAKKDQNAKITIPEDYTTSSRREGTFECDLFCEPMDGEPLEISISGLKNSDKMPFKSEYGRPAGAWDGPSISENWRSMPLWKKVDANGELAEIFEGVFTMKVSYTGKFANRGYGSGVKQTISFWAVRDRSLRVAEDYFAE